MRFIPQVRETRPRRQITLREIVQRLGRRFSYISKVENERYCKLGYRPIEKLNLLLADMLEADAEELRQLADQTENLQGLDIVISNSNDPT